MVQAKAILAQYVLTIVLFEGCKFVSRLDLSPVEHSLVHLFLLSFLVLLLKGDEADFFHLAVLS